MKKNKSLSSFLNLKNPLDVGKKLADGNRVKGAKPDLTPTDNESTNQMPDEMPENTESGSGNAGVNRLTDKRVSVSSTRIYFLDFWTVS